MWIFDPSCEEAAAENKKDVGEDGAKHAGLDNPDLSILQRHNTDLYLDLAKARRSSADLQLTINSTAFPNVALSNPPKVWPTLTDSSSVAKLRSAARGMIAKKFRTKTAVGLHPRAPAIMPSGTKTRRKFT